MRASLHISWLAAFFISSTTLLSTAHAADTSESEALSIFLEVPKCALDCFQKVSNEAGEESCGSQDLQCLCNAPVLEDRVKGCIMTSCSVKETLIARNATQIACDRPIRDNSSTFVIVAILFSVLSGLFVIQRFAVKIWSPQLSLGLDDWVILGAALLQAPAAIVGCTGGVASGLGRDVWTLTPTQITNFAYYLYIYTTLYFSNVALCKLAFLLFYLRVFPAPRVRRILWSTVGFVGVFGLTFLLASIFQCTPVSHYWHRWDGEHEGTCIDPSALAWANSGISIALDFFMIGIPLSQLRHLNLDWRKKMGVGAMFGVGLFVTIISIVRLESLITHGWESPNATWVKMDVAVWSTVEINVAIICACMPSLRSLVVRAFPRLKFWSSSEGENDYPEGNMQMGFGTISRSRAERHPDMPLPTRPGAIALHRTYAVEFGARDSEDTDVEERGLVPLKSLDKLSSGSGSHSRSYSDSSR